MVEARPQRSGQQPERAVHRPHLEPRRHQPVESFAYVIRRVAMPPHEHIDGLGQVGGRDGGRVRGITQQLLDVDPGRFADEGCDQRLGIENRNTARLSLRT
jgi:hypothetical protein